MGHTHGHGSGSEREKMLEGQAYDSQDPQLVAARDRAGTVVTRDVPPDVFAAGNPRRVLRPLNQPPLNT